VPATKSPAAGKQTEAEPTSAAARRAAGLPPLPAAETPVDAGTGAADPGMAAPDVATTGEVDAAPQAAPVQTHVPGPGAEVNEGNLTPEELDLVRQLRTSRGQEILSKLAEAPVGVGTDADPYVLYHLRGCPDPRRREIFEAKRPDGRLVTIKRCIQCGVQNNIEH
jgi:hypothetical protein